MNADGSEAKQMTFGAYEDSPQISPDGRWIVYHSESERFKDEVWRVSIEGGEPIKVLDVPAKNPVISPDGKFIACYVKAGGINSGWKIGVMPFEGGVPVKMIDVPPAVSQQWHGLRWTPNSMALTYALNDGGTSGIWSQAITGGTPRKITGSIEGHIDAFTWSPSGRHLACVRRRTESDIVLINNFR